MKEIRAFFTNKDQRLSFILFVCLGIIAVSAAYIYGVSPFKEIGMSIGSVILSIPIISLVWKILGGDPINKRMDELNTAVSRLEQATDIIKDCENVGVQRLIDRAANFGSQRDWMQLFENSRKEIDILGRTMFAWIDGTELDEIILRKLEEGVRIRWLIMGSENKYLHLIEENETTLANVVSDKLPKVNKFLEAVLTRVPARQRNRFQIKTFDNVPLYGNLARFDETYYITPYFYYKSSKNSPLLVLRGTESPWGSMHQAEFEQIWKKSKDFLPS